MKLSVILALVGLIAYVNADLYMQVPSGSNNRLNEANTNRDNNNRLFDSQNNAKGGYCFGPSMSYYERSLLTVEWTSQHGCGSDKQECNIVLQYMCSKYNNPAEDFPEDQIRDGGTTQTPTTDKATQATEQDNTVDGMGFQYGQHENYYWYTWCRARDRNHGLYTADRNVNNNAGASATRQNNNGGRSGLECAEERDYYPYWHPAPWKDIAILVDDESLCGYFKDESQNVKAKGYCYDPADPNSNITFAWSKYNNPIDCQKNSLTWAEWPSWGIAAPECVKNIFTRDNHLGNTANGFNAHYNWTLPTSGQEPCIDDDNCNCVLRIRYNISTIDFSGYKVPFADSTNNDGAAFLEQDPDLPVLREDCVNGVEAGTPCNVTLAIDTSQFARTFQDRSYVFHIKARPKGVSNSARVFNLNVKGKRGNIVQAYPSTEYDFHPHQLETRVGDYIHFQWTGCDTNPAGNAGEGTAGTDRSNMVQIESIGQSVPASLSFLKGGSLFESEYLRNRMAFLDQSNCKSYEELNAAGNNADQDKDNCQNLNKADPYFDGGLVKMNKTGTFYYMSSRNNNFTNRGQKGTLSVSAILPTWGIAIVSVGAGLFVASLGAGAAMFYAKTHPHSAVANALGKL